MGLALAGALAPPWEGYSIDGKAYAQEAQNVEKGITTILIVGCDQRPGDLGRTDTILVGFLNMESGELNVLSIPRDTYVNIPSSGEKTKLNHAYSYGGITLTENTIASNFGINIDCYAEVNFETFSQLVDAMGGITIDVEKPMSVPEENINLAAGVQHLNGEQALGYVRFRGDPQADIGRIARQQKFLEVLAEELFSPGTVWIVPKLIKVAEENIQTDLKTTEMITLANSVRKIGVSSIQFYMMPGTPDMIRGISYWVPDEEETQMLIDDIMNIEKVNDDPSTINDTEAKEN